MTAGAGNACPVTSARITENVPAPSPFQATMTRGLRAEMFRVKLLSSPHNVQAARIPSAPGARPHCPLFSHDRRMLASVISPTAHPVLRPTASWKINPAMSVVATLSKLRSSAAVAAGVLRRLNIKRIGAAIPPADTAPASQGRSLRCKRASPAGAVRR